MKNMFRILTLAITCLFSSYLAASPAQIVQLAQYIAVDYPGAVADGKVINAGEFAEMREFSQRAVDLLAAETTTKQHPNSIQALRTQALQLQQAVSSKASAKEVNDQASKLAQQVISAFEIKTVPTKVVDVSTAKQLYAAKCASCHGANGDGKGPLAQVLQPKPTNFLDKDTMRKVSVYGLYNTITLGVAGTPMMPFDKILDEPQRWGLAFYVASLANETNKAEAAGTVTAGGQGGGSGSGPDLQQLTSMSAEQISATYGVDGLNSLDALRANPEVVLEKMLAAETNADSKWELINQYLDLSWKDYQAGEADAAYAAALRAYLDGFEPLEPSLDTHDHQLRLATERALMDYRGLLRGNASQVEVKAALDGAHAALDQARAAIEGRTLDNMNVLVSAILILLREGLEMILVVAFVLAFLAKTERKHLFKHVHVGWLGAVGAGLLTWAASHYLLQISGVQRELAEGAAALLAAVVLLSVGFWLHRATVASEWQTFIRNSLSRSLGTGSVLGLVSLVFIAVYREMFETILFYETLWLQTAHSAQHWVLAGFVIALAILFAVVLALVKFGVKLPIKQFFKVSTVLMFALAIIFVGQGFHSLEEAGKIPEISLNIFTIAPLGIYPSLISVASQVALALAVLLYMGLQKRTAK